MINIRSHSWLDKFYVAGLILKGVDGLLELLGGIFLLVTPLSVFNSLTSWILHSELGENPHNFFASHILHATEHLATSHNWFLIAFFLLHGIVKIILVVALFKGKMCAYSFALIALGLFCIYEIYKVIVSMSVFTAFLTLIDIAIIWLIWREWRRVKTGDSAGSG